METAHKTNEEKQEFFDSEEDLDLKCTLLAQMIQSSSHFVAFTGAGISTSAGIPDYRSGINTVLPTGPGAWEKLATNTKAPKVDYKTKALSAIPSVTHMSLVKLQQVGRLKFIISQNTDGLHRKSGFPASHIAEVHGNTNLEICKNKSCKRTFMRDFKARNSKKVHDHKTGRQCESCGKDLYDSIINFGENLSEYELNTGFEQCGKADLCLALGSSLRVTPAADMVLETVQNKGKLVIVNLQKTPHDPYALKINGLIDDVMSRVMKKLELEIPPFKLVRRVMVCKTDVDLKDPRKKTKNSLVVRGCDEQGKPYTLFTKIQATFSDGKEDFSSKKDPMIVFPEKTGMAKGSVKVKLSFHGYYQEPDFVFDLNMEELNLNKPVYFKMEYDPKVKRWDEFKAFCV